MDIRNILSYAKIYDLWGKIIKPRDNTFHFFRDWVGKTEGLSVLDLGCGTGTKLEHIAGVRSYVGVDISEEYIAAAKETYKDRKECSFYCVDLNEFAASSQEKFDLITMHGVMHHINDYEVNNAMESIKKLLSPEGRFVSLDGCYTSGMNPIARVLLNFDRGDFVRSEDDWVKLMGKHWKKMNYQIRTDSLRLPYSIIVFDCMNKDV